MKSRHRLIFSVCLALLSGTCLSAPSLAQKGDVAALSAKINELGRAGKYAEAVALAQGQVESLEKKFGPAHRDVGAALNNLAQALRQPGQGWRGRAAVQASHRDPGEDGRASTRLRSRAVLNNLAALYQRQQRYADAEPLFKRALAVREKSLGHGHPDLGQSLNNLATHYEKLGRHGDSEPLFKRALAIYEKAAGPEHPAVATLSEQSRPGREGPAPLCRGRAADPAVAGDSRKSAGPRSSRCGALAEQSRRPL